MTGYFNRFAGITADVAGQNGAFGSASRYSFLFGPTFRVRLPVLSPFAHALFGVVKETSGSDSQYAFTKAEFALGGGVDVHVSRHLAVRPIQLDYEWAKHPHQRNPQPSTGFRLSAGVVFKL